AIGELYRRSKGIPRLINVVADRALLAAYTRDRTRVDAALVRRAAAEVFGRPALPFTWPLFTWPWAAAAAAACVAAIAAGSLDLWGREATVDSSAASLQTVSTIARTAAGAPADRASRGAAAATATTIGQSLAAPAATSRPSAEAEP